MIALKNVLVATDFGEAADAALAYGRQFARTFGATLHVVHVVDDITARAVGLGGIPEYVGSIDRVQADVERAARSELERRLSDEDRVALRAKPVILSSTSPAWAIADYARTEGVDLVVAGTHGRGAVAHFLMGSIAERLVRTAPCPVLTVHHPEREFVLPDALQAVARTP